MTPSDRDREEIRNMIHFCGCLSLMDSMLTTLVEETTGREFLPIKQAAEKFQKSVEAEMKRIRAIVEEGDSNE